MINTATHKLRQFVAYRIVALVGASVEIMWLFSNRLHWSARGLAPNGGLEKWPDGARHLDWRILGKRSNKQPAGLRVGRLCVCVCAGQATWSNYKKLGYRWQTARRIALYKVLADS